MGYVNDRGQKLYAPNSFDFDDVGNSVSDRGILYKTTWGLVSADLVSRLHAAIQHVLLEEVTITMFIEIYPSISTGVPNLISVSPMDINYPFGTRMPVVYDYLESSKGNKIPWPNETENGMEIVLSEYDELVIWPKYIWYAPTVIGKCPNEVLMIELLDYEKRGNEYVNEPGQDELNVLSILTGTKFPQNLSDSYDRLRGHLWGRRSDEPK